MIGLLGKKIGMTQIFDKAGQSKAVTVLEVGPCTVLQVKQKDGKDGYQAVQLGFLDKKLKRTSKSEAGHAKKSNATPKRFVKEIRTDSLEGLQPGAELRVNNFAIGDWIDVIGTSIGRGYQGVVKRHHFKGAQTKSHGTKHGREPGSIGQSAFPSRVLKGTKMPGHMGNERVTLQNLKVVNIDLENNIMAVSGAVPGPKDGYLIIREAIKKRRPRAWRAPDQPVEELQEKVVQQVTKKAKAAAKPAAKK
ncbi:MAG: 50S ribosomal protein L3 [Candidatus Omnitrophica bacterium CG11_big_fil_rev_8_21_14_0_20_45_26]|uniref:Large ribosomal subunit protein uL3 n=1 Tax=Candidatus Abzuiibacterium crystallinum TaxID=1974748 RepID=A0A2H0LNF0_9BACT|nr:MAG: 50S ribosomal protein L3 [Candidatus Omnitrophica bacterium CG11_big_fil_rev_8_21_14_0_20_45_26]PIW65108.1 MAG: 50S ribosomal protein L3 [Candidatus Omnitrophica bacterium CG12_big_fil_rev_8_21_14_0_65_45_16]